VAAAAMAIMAAALRLLPWQSWQLRFKVTFLSKQTQRNCHLPS
jgi:hypothetical protein